MKFIRQVFYVWVSVMTCMLFSFPETEAARWGDGAGPEGLGPKTGRGVGYCTGYTVPGSQNTTVPRLGLGRASFQSRGGRYSNIYKATGLTRLQRNATSTGTVNAQQTITQEQRLEALKKQADLLKNELGTITRQINEIESKK